MEQNLTALEKIKWLQEAYISCYSEYKSAYQISRELRGYVHHNYKKYMEENKEYFHIKEGTQKGDILWKAKTKPIISIIQNQTKLNKKEEDQLIKIIDSDTFRRSVKFKKGFENIYRIIDLIQVMSSIAWVSKQYKKHTTMKKPKGVRADTFQKQLIRKSKRILTEIFPYLKKVRLTEEQEQQFFNLNDNFFKMNNATLQKLMRLEYSFPFLPELVASTLVTVEAYHTLHKSYQ